MKIIYKTVLGNREISGFEGDCPKHLVLGPESDSNDYKVYCGAFEGAEALEEVTFNEGLKSLLDNSFKDCVNLKKINFKFSQDARPTIYNEAFVGTPLFREENGMKIVGDILIKYTGTDVKVVIPEGIKYIGDKAFEDSCVEQVIFPESLVEIWAKAFYGSALQSATLGENVRYIGKEAFRACTSLKQLVINSALDYVGWCAFCDMGINELSFPVPPKRFRDFLGFSVKELSTTYDDGNARYHNGILLEYYGEANEEYTIAPGTWMIGECAFWGKRLNKVNLPESLVFIGDRAFSGTSLRGSITIGKNLAIGENVFGDTNISELIIESGNSLMSVYENTLAIHDCAELERIVIPEGMRKLKLECEGCKMLRSLTLPESIKSFHIRAPKSGIKSIVLNGLIDDFSMKQMSFRGYLPATAAKKFTFYVPDDLVEAYNERFSAFVLDSGDNITFAPKSKMKVPKAKAPKDEPEKSVEDMAKLIFADCESTVMIEGKYLTINSTMPNSNIVAGVMEIDSKKGASQIDWEAVKTVRQKAETADGKATLFVIGECSKVSRILLSKWKAQVQRYEIPEGVTSIPDYMFDGCTALQEVVIPGSVTKIGERAFIHCTSLNKVEIPESVSEIGESAFGYCAALRKFAFPQNMTHISACIFKDCTSLAEVIIPEGVKEIRVEAFRGCSSLCDIKLPQGLTEISGQLFYGCSSLRGISIPENVELIKYEVFFGCTSIEEIVVPSQVKEIGRETFKGCSSLRRVVLPDEVNLSESAFDECDYGKLTLENSRFVIENEFLIDTQEKVLMRYYGNGDTDVVIPANLTEIGERAFYETPIKAITIPKNIQRIGLSAFSSCDELVEAEIPDSITEIDCFYHCEKLKKVSLPEGLKKIDEYCFCGNKSLEEIVLPESLEEVGKNAFSGCCGLKSVTIRNPKTKFGRYVFEWCESIEEVVLPAGLNKDKMRTKFRNTPWEKQNFQD